MRDLKTIVNDAIKAAVAELAATGQPFTSVDASARAFATIDDPARDALALRSVWRATQRFVNDRRLKATASQATHETTTSTLALEGGFPALWSIT